MHQSARMRTPLASLHAQLGLCLCTLSVTLQLRALTRGEVDESEAGDAALKLLSDLVVPLPDLIELMGGVSLYEVEILFEANLRELIGSALYTFVSILEVCVLSHCARTRMELTRCTVYHTLLHAVPIARRPAACPRQGATH